MTLPLTAPADEYDDLEQTPPKRFPSRWRLHRGGIVNVWFYYDEEFTFSGGRVIWRGTNGAGKSRALEMLLPFVFDADRRGIDATGQGKVRLEELMSAGFREEGTNRVGYLWLELKGEADGGGDEYLTVGVFIRYSKASAEAKAWYFLTDRRVGDGLPLIDENRHSLSRDQLSALIGADALTEAPEKHRERVRAQVFGLPGELGKERFTGLLRLLHVLRNPDVGNKIEAGLLPSIVSDSLPPLAETALGAAGEQLDGLSETRDAQRELEADAAHVATFLGTYRRYAAGVLGDAAEAARAAAGVVRERDGDVRDAVQRREDLTRRHAEARTARVELEDTERALDGTIAGIRGSQAYADAAELDEVAGRVAAVRGTAERSLGAAEIARRAEARSVAAADGRAEEVAGYAKSTARQLADLGALMAQAGMSADVLPAAVTAGRTEPPPRTDTVRTTADADPGPVLRPQPQTLTVTPADPAEVSRSVRNVAAAARTRADQAGNRLTAARSLAGQLRRVEGAEETAERAGDAAETAEADAVDAADARDDAATALAGDWRTWVAAPATTAALGPVDWPATAVGPLLADAGALTGEADDEEQLAELDRAADDAAVAARQRIADDRAGLRARQEAADAEREELGTEARELRAERDPAPAAPPWQTAAPAGGVPLWRAVEFTGPLAADDAPATEKAGLEAALLAAGLLTAHLTRDGTLTATDGQVLLSAAGPTADRPLTAALAADPASPLDPAVVTDLLARIALDDPTHPVWVGRDGAWGNGPLHGKHIAPAARHIGAQARAAARAQRLAEIATRLEQLDAEDVVRAAEAEALTAATAGLVAQLRTAPRTAALARARVQAAAAARQAERADRAARTARAEAERLRTEWRAAAVRHAEACRAFGLPTDADALAVVAGQARDVAAGCDLLAGRFTELAAQLARHAAALQVVDADAAGRAEAEEIAAADWLSWHTADAELVALRASVGEDVAAIREQLADAEAERGQVRLKLGKARDAEGDLGGKAGEATARASAAEERAADARTALAAALLRLRRVADLPGLVAAALPGEVQLPELPAADPVAAQPAAVEAAARAVLTAAAAGRGGAVDQTAAGRAVQALQSDLTGTFDVLTTVAEGVLLVELVDASGPRSVAAAHGTLTARVAEGRTALTEREREVFTRFVLGGVAEELQRRIKQAQELVDAMNASLSTIRTSHGISVRVNWSLAVPDGSPLARIRELVGLPGEMRTPEQDGELIALITARVEEQLTLDATAGYAAHLKAALDYRSWYEVDVRILGPGPGQDRGISKRSKLSQGETRFVSYITLFAAVDAYLSGLPDISRALRLIVLDDAFAKVDNRTIGVLMGLLVRLDIDFAMTGHNLWGTYRQVPELDIYEVRRREGGAAVTTHVFWDGHTKHLRVAR